MTWHKTSEVLPDFYDVLGIQITNSVLGKDAKSNYYITSLWRDRNDTWRTTTDETPNIIYWKELE